MTLVKLMRLYQHFKNDYDFRLTKTPFKKIENDISTDGEWLPDD